MGRQFFTLAQGGLILPSAIERYRIVSYLIPLCLRHEKTFVFVNKITFVQTPFHAASMALMLTCDC